MKKLMTMENFLKNPTGKYSAGFARRDLIIANLEQRYQMLLAISKTFNFKVFMDEDDYVFYFKIPSETFTNQLLYYDVVIRFVCSNPGLLKPTASINGYHVNVFTNSPDFTFTYAYLYNQDGVVDPKMKRKIGSKALNNPPVVKNPYGIYGFEKSVYYALLFIKRNRYTLKSEIEKVIDTKMSYSKLYSQIKSTDEKYKEYNMMKLKEKQAKAKEKKKKNAEKRTNMKGYSSKKK